MLLVVNLHNGDGVLKWVLKLIPLERVCDLSGPYVDLFDYGLCKEGVELCDRVRVMSGVQY